MKKLHMLFALVLGLLTHSAWAAPIGWYQFDATWRDGSFQGQFYYDSAAPQRITAVQGLLSSLAQTTAIEQNFYLDQDELAPWNFLANTNPAVLGNHDAGFYLTLLDAGSTLTLDLAGLNLLYDWSNDAFYNPDQLDASPLLSFSLREANAVPEPATGMLLLAGMAGLFGLRRGRARQA